MAHIRIDYSELQAAATASGQTATEMDQYASSIEGKLANKLGSLTGGSSSYTTAASSLAHQKATSLRTRAAAYGRLKSGLEALASHAHQADSASSTRIKSIKSADSEGLAWYQKLNATIYDFYANTLGRTSFGRFLNRIVNLRERADQLLVTGAEKVRDFFQYGKGRYLLKIGLSAAAAIAAAVAVFNPVTGPFATVIAIAAGVGALYKVGTFLATFDDNVKALKLDDESPGKARYYSKTSSLKDWAKKNTTDSGLQNLAGGLDAVGITAGVFTNIGGLYTTKLPDGVDAAGNVVKDGKTLNWSSQTLVTNVKNEFKISNFLGFKSAGEGVSAWEQVDTFRKNVKGVDKLVSDCEHARRSLVYDHGLDKTDYKNMIKRVPAFGKFATNGFDYADALT